MIQPTPRSKALSACCIAVSRATQRARTLELARHQNPAFGTERGLTAFPLDAPPKLNDVTA